MCTYPSPSSQTPPDLTTLCNLSISLSSSSASAPYPLQISLFSLIVHCSPPITHLTSTLLSTSGYHSLTHKLLVLCSRSAHTPLLPAQLQLVWEYLIRPLYSASTSPKNLQLAFLTYIAYSPSNSRASLFHIPSSCRPNPLSWALPLYPIVRQVMEHRASTHNSLHPTIYLLRVPGKRQRESILQ